MCQDRTPQDIRYQLKKENESMPNQWFPKIEVHEDAKKLTKQGGIGVLLFSALNFLGVLIAYYANKSPVDASTLDAQAIQDHVVGAFIVIPLLILFAWRIYKGKGWLVAGIALIWFVVEVVLKIAGGATNVGWMFFYVGVASMIFNGLRGCWWLRKTKT